MKPGDIVLFKEGGFSYAMPVRIVACGNFWFEVEFPSGNTIGTSRQNLIEATPEQKKAFFRHDLQMAGGLQ